MSMGLNEFTNLYVDICVAYWDFIYLFFLRKGKKRNLSAKQFNMGKKKSFTVADI